MSQYSDEDIAEARGKLGEAFALTGLIEGGEYVCPACGVVHHGGTLNLRPDIGWKCWKTNERGNAVDLLMERKDLSFPDAVGTLLGRPPSGKEDLVLGKGFVLPDLDPAADCVPNREVYSAVLDVPGERGVEEAIKFWGDFHISPEVVVDHRTTFWWDPESHQKELLDRFGLDALKECGLVREDKKGRPVWLVSERYPVVEPHLSPSGLVCGLQFRCSQQVARRHRQHQEWKRKQALFEAGRGPEPKRKVNYVPKMLSLAGVGPDDSLIGCGFPQVCDLPVGSTIVVVEGFKDVLAAATMGRVAFGIAGVSAGLGENTISVLSNYRLAVALDGDEAGESGKERVVAYLRDNGLDAFPVDMPEGMDVADILAERAQCYGRYGLSLR